MLLLEHGNPVLALLLVFPDGLLDTRIERVELHFPLLPLFQSVLENVQANDDKFVLVGEWLLRQPEAVSGAGLVLGDEMWRTQQWGDLYPPA